MKLYLPYYYDDVKDVFLWFAKKYWPDQEIVPFPNKTPVGWTNGVIDYFKKIKDEYLIMVPEDFFFLEPVNKTNMWGCELFATKKEVDKIELTGCFNQFKGKCLDNLNGCEFYEVPQDIDYRSTLHPSIWKREYFLKVAKPGQAWWRFENATVARNDGAKVYGVEPPPIGKLLNFMWRGKANHKVFHLAKDKEDIQKIEELAKKYK